MNAHQAAKRTRTPPRRARGQGTIEFQIIAVAVLLPLLMAVLQVGLLVIAKETLNVATLEVARAGAASGGDRGAMDSALAIGLAPLFASGAKSATGVGTGDITSGNYAQVMGAALGMAKLNMLDPRAGVKITVINPSVKSFADFGVDKPGVGVVIPVTSVVDNMATGASSGQTRADALLLKIEVRYCHKMVVPLIGPMVSKVLSTPSLRSGPPSGQDLLCYLAERIPMSSQAVVRMTVPPIKSELLR